MHSLFSNSGIGTGHLTDQFVSDIVQTLLLNGHQVFDGRLVRQRGGAQQQHLFQIGFGHIHGAAGYFSRQIHHDEEQGFQEDVLVFQHPLEGHSFKQELDGNAAA